MRIRAALETDRDAIWRIFEPVIRAGETYALPADMTRGEALAHWFEPDRTVNVAEDGEVVGTYYLRASRLGGGGHVANSGFVTAPWATGRGIARAMAVDSLERAKARGFTAMQFNFVVSTNERAIGLWRNLGFDVAGRLPGAFRHPTLGFVDALIMYRSL
jgi:ribosomal protein S18 acetylase RimI-like enzyme